MGALSAAFAVIYNLDKQKEIEFEKVRKAVVSEAIQAGFDALNQYEIFRLAARR